MREPWARSDAARGVVERGGAQGAARARGIDDRRLVLHVAISVLVYDRAGATWVGIAQVCRLVPAALAAPFLASLVDRYPKQRVLFATDALRALIMTGLCLGAALGAPLLVLLGLASLNTAREHAVLARAGRDAPDARARARGAHCRERHPDHDRVDRLP